MREWVGPSAVRIWSWSWDGRVFPSPSWGVLGSRTETVMHEILAHLQSSQYVLDLGCGSGSFDRRKYPFTTIRVDISFDGDVSVQADASQLPFKNRMFDAVICNHSLEHFEDLDGALLELRRVAKQKAAVFVSVPDASTVTDRIYRWLAQGGGHVNGFCSEKQLAKKIESRISLKHQGTRLLLTSLSFLNRRNWDAPAPKRLFLLGGGRESVLIPLNYFFRIIDRLLGTRLAVYGWAMYFGHVPAGIDAGPWMNVCVRCGAGHRAAALVKAGRVQCRWAAFRTWACSICEATNLFTDEEFGLRYH